MIYKVFLLLSTFFIYSCSKGQCYTDTVFNPRMEWHSELLRAIKHPDLSFAGINLIGMHSWEESTWVAFRYTLGFKCRLRRKTRSKVYGHLFWYVHSGHKKVSTFKWVCKGMYIEKDYGHQMQIVIQVAFPAFKRTRKFFLKKLLFI